MVHGATSWRSYVTYDEQQAPPDIDRALLRRVIGYAKPYRGLLALVLVTVVIDALLGLIPPLLMRSLIDTAIPAGDLGLVTLPGEPLNGLAREIQARSPFPHTVVTGYSNGFGVGYVGLPGEKARGGYEAGAGRGTEEAGLFMIETAVRLLQEVSREDSEA